MSGESVVMTSAMTPTVPCPLCGAEPGQPCRDTRGRITSQHRSRSRRADHPIAAEVASSALTVRIGPADRRRVLTEELAKARAKYEQLRFAIDYLEGELAK